MPKPTKWFSSSMAGAPVCKGTLSALIDLLTACLMDGFNAGNLTSLVVASNVATATRTAHGFLQYQVVNISGATPAELNGDFRILTVTANTFTFATVNVSDQTATGTISAKTPAASSYWGKPFTGTNLATFRSTDPAGTQRYLRIDDTVALYSALSVYEDMSAISTGTNTWGNGNIKKSNTADATARPWIVVADSRTVYIFIAWTSTSSYELFSFGDFESFAPGDTYAYLLHGNGNSAPVSFGRDSTALECAASSTFQTAVCTRNYAGVYTPTSLAQVSMSAAIGPAVAVALSGFSTQSSPAMASTGLADNGYHFFPVYLVETAVTRFIRGVKRGVMHLYETVTAGAASILTGISGVDEGLMLYVNVVGVELGGSTVRTGAVGIKLGAW